MKKLFTILFLSLTLAVQAQRQQISYIEETKNWYYVYDEQGKRIGGLARSSVGELKGWGSDFFGRERKSVQEVLNEKKLLKYLNFSPIVTILSSETNKNVKDEESIY